MIHILAWCLFGLFAGMISRMMAPGQYRLGLVGTMVVGICGSLIGGGLYQVVFENNLDFSRIEPAGFLGAVVGGVILLTISYIIGSERSV